MRLLFFISIFEVLTSFNDSPHNQSPIEKTLEVQLIFQNRAERQPPCPLENIDVLIINHTDSVASFFDDKYLWGYFNICFQISTADTTYTIYKRDRDFTKNYPAFKTLFPGDTMLLKFSLDYGYCTLSDFDPLRPMPSRPFSIKAIYQLSKETLESAGLSGQIKYKKIYIPAEKKGIKGTLMIIDSLQTPVEVNRTFPLSRLESKKYYLN